MNPRLRVTRLRVTWLRVTWLRVTRLRVKGVALMALASVALEIGATPPYYADHAKGWHWYQDPPPAKKTARSLSTTPPSNLSAVRLALKEALDAALFDPTPDKVKHYLLLQNAFSQRASRFAEMWQAVLLHTPQLNFALSHPTNQLGRAIYLDAVTAQEDAVIRTLAQENGLFFFYKSTCPYCRRFAPIVKAFSQRYGLSVIPITTDGIALPAFPQSRVDGGQARRFQVRVTPALFTVNPHTQQVIPLAYGLISEQELRQRLLEMATLKRRS